MALGLETIVRAAQPTLALPPYVASGLLGGAASAVAVRFIADWFGVETRKAWYIGLAYGGAVALARLGLGYLAQHTAAPPHHRGV